MMGMLAAGVAHEINNAAVTGKVVLPFDPGPQESVEAVDRFDPRKVEPGQERRSYVEEPALDFSTTLGAIGFGVEQMEADLGGDGKQLLAAEDLGVVDIQALGNAALKLRPV